MDGDDTYGSAFADVYDEWYADSDELDDVLAVLCESGPRRVLELGVGTGRVAIPLAARLAASGAVRVVGVDESAEMLARLAAKDERGLVTAVVGDMVDDQPDETFDLVFFSYNTLFNVADRDRQVRCLANAARRLSAGGLVVVDACVIDEHAPPVGVVDERRGGWSLRTRTSFDAGTGLLDGVIESRHDDGRDVSRPFRILYSAPRTIDEMCSAGGLALERRDGTWARSGFRDDSPRHVSTYRLVR